MTAAQLDYRPVRLSTNSESNLVDKPDWKVVLVVLQTSGSEFIASFASCLDYSMLMRLSSRGLVNEPMTRDV